MVKQVTQKQDIEFLENYRKKLLRQQQILPDLAPWEFHSSNEPQTPSPEDEKVARFADDFGFDGSLFRNSSPYDDDYQLWMKWTSKNIQKKIDTVFRVIAAITKPPNRSIIPDGVELLTVPQVARLLNCGESVIRERDKKGLLPLPIRIGGTIQWRRQELLQWLEADCPARQKWEALKRGKEIKKNGKTKKTVQTF